MWGGWLIGAALLGASGCAQPRQEQICTEIGCNNDLSIKVVDAQGAQVSGVHGTITAGDTTYAVDCAAPEDLARQVQCSADTITIGGPNDLPSSITVALSAGELHYSGAVTLDVIESRPNGPECDPVCRLSAATVTLIGP
jgi:hypothetical protein